MGIEGQTENHEKLCVVLVHGLYCQYQSEMLSRSRLDPCLWLWLCGGTKLQMGIERIHRILKTLRVTHDLAKKKCHCFARLIFYRQCRRFECKNLLTGLLFVVVVHKYLVWEGRRHSMLSHCEQISVFTTAHLKELARNSMRFYSKAFIPILGLESLTRLKLLVCHQVRCSGVEKNLKLRAWRDSILSH